jgi:hypothetical protein
MGGDQRRRHSSPPVLVHDGTDDEDEAQKPRNVDVDSPFGFDGHGSADKALNHENKKGSGEEQEQAVTRFHPKAGEEHGDDQATDGGRAGEELIEHG